MSDQLGQRMQQTAGRCGAERNALMKAWLSLNGVATPMVRIRPAGVSAFGEQKSSEPRLL
jgi:hypothetical protein